jgi:acetyltransferase-like isoleucine patch superfamily enzyme
MLFDIYQRTLRRIAYHAPGGFRIRPNLHRLRGVTIGKNVWISQYVYIDEIHPESIYIGDNVSIGIGSLIIAHFYWGPRRASNTGTVTIENDVFIGPHCVVLPGVTIGHGAVIGAGTVISRNVPAKTLWASPKANAIAEVTVPLTHDYSYEQFSKGIRPLNWLKK